MPGLGSLHVAYTFEELVQLEQTAERKHQALAGLAGEEYDAQWIRWRDAAERFQAAVSEHVAQDDVDASRFEIEQAVKKAVRHPDPEAPGQP